MSHIGRTTVLAVLGLGLFASVAQARHCGPEDPTLVSLGCKVIGDTCWIRDSPGGYTDSYLAEAKKYRSIIIDGPCDSACEDVAEKYWKKTRITGRASFGFHQLQEVAYYKTGKRAGCPYDSGIRTPSKHLPAIQKWIDARGGEPRNKLLRMSFKDAKRLGVWRVYAGSFRDLR